MDPYHPVPTCNVTMVCHRLILNGSVSALTYMKSNHGLHRLRLTEQSKNPPINRANNLHVEANHQTNELSVFVTAHAT